MKEKPNLSSSERFRSALDYATTLHATQYRKGTDIPYISHLYSVAALVMEAEGTEDEVIGALLHDAAEDQGGQEVLDTIRDRFGNKAADIVAGCTDDMPGKGEAKKPWWERKQAYIAHLQDSSHSVRLVSNADKLHNASASNHTVHRAPLYATA
jgi:(p)ppGpp synthase/HD superfamily hydrolase